jgi:hypothetical protein
VPEGALFVNVRAVQAGDSYKIITPRGVVTIGQPGRYEVVAGDMANPTTVTVVEGAAQITGDDINVTITDRQTAQLTGTENFQASVGGEVSDPFLARTLAPPSAPPRSAHTPPPVVMEMTGGDALAETGSWAHTPEYGEVWYPPVQAEWVPYREGHWAFVVPWGWTWVDDASWGFAPFHYGRWVRIGPRWGWIPVAPGIADYGRPVYSPALVSFVGLGVGAVIGASVCWIPLGPREAYHPRYHASDDYRRRMNMADGARITNTKIDHFANRDGATIVPAAAMTSSEPIARRAEKVTPQILASARPDAAIPVRPTTATPGPFHDRPTAPGPAIQARRPPVAFQPPPQAGAHFAPAVPHVVEPGRPGMGAPGFVESRPAPQAVRSPAGAAPAPGFAPHVHEMAPPPAIQPLAPIAPMPPAVTAMPPAVTAMPPAVTAHPPAVTAMPPAVTAHPPAVTAMPPAVTPMVPRPVMPPPTLRPIQPPFVPRAAPPPPMRREAPQFRPAAPAPRPAPQRGEEPRRF